MEPDQTEPLDWLATVISGCANLPRLALLLGFSQGYTAQEVTDILEISRPGVQKNIERMIEADLVYRPAADDAPTYALTPIGEFFASFIDDHGPVLLTALTILRDSEATIQQQLEDSPVADGMSQTEQDRLVHTRKWQETNNQIHDLLERHTHDRPGAAESSIDRAFATRSPFSREEFGDILDEVKEDDVDETNEE
ncbi:hypothetical protein NGM10_02060 [Halorussus salilacus]|uniref:hypothetical protein n=1 Tax=Halorussus salilacus TaxID=2953750 RepID=UPI0020A20624|nr:hypothetical protein [Halorussus salilacus]USZ68536.1 hypothetical protein NGM10_02060 [Halorussus salilacus]